MGLSRDAKTQGRGLRTTLTFLRHNPHFLTMTKVALFLTLIMLLAGCTAGPPTTACPDPDPNPISPCATSHSETHDRGS